MGLDNLKPAKGATSNRRELDEVMLLDREELQARATMAINLVWNKAKLHFEGGQTPLAEDYLNVVWVMVNLIILEKIKKIFKF